MKLAIILIMINVALAAKVDDEWTVWKKKNGKKYGDAGKESKRRGNWDANAKRIKQHNDEAKAGKYSYTLAMNQFGDLSKEEFNAIFNRLDASEIDSGMNVRDITDEEVSEMKRQTAPASVNLTATGYVTPVKYQGGCGSCWAFSAVAAIEGALFRKTGKLVAMSEQNLVDCSSAYGNYGCNGGSTTNAWKYVKAVGGINTESTYPYVAKNDVCKYNPSNNAASIASWTKVTNTGNEALMAQLVANNYVLTVAMDANDFQFYSSGVYSQSTCTQTVNHGMAIVGYGTHTDGQAYWLIKNSWGTGWGMNGYMMMPRNAANKCRVASFAYYVNLV